VTRRWPPGQWLLRALVVAGPLVALFATVPAGATPRWWLVLLVGGLAGLFALLPESAAGPAAYVLVVAWWGVGLRDGVHPAALLAAAGLLASHLAATVAALGPGTLPVDPAVLRRWGLRGLLVLPSAALTLAVVAVVRDQPAPPGLWAVGLAALLAGLVAADALFVRRPG
jgi:hypothetical protein